MAMQRHGLTVTMNVSLSPWPPILGYGNSGLLNLKIWSTAKSTLNGFGVSLSDYTHYRTGRVLMRRQNYHPKNEGSCQLLQRVPKPTLPRTTRPIRLTGCLPNHSPNSYRTPAVSLNLSLQAPIFVGSSLQKSLTFIVQRMSALPNL